jgi:hypothetical protein
MAFKFQQLTTQTSIVLPLYGTCIAMFMDIAVSDVETSFLLLSWKARYFKENWYIHYFQKHTTQISKSFMLKHVWYIFKRFYYIFITLYI